jgi:hypothetical protein
MSTEFKIPRTPKELLNLMGNSDPVMQMLANIIESQSSYSTKKNVNSNNITISRLKKEYTTLLERNNILASALGACPFCWGTNVECECRGEGKVGSRVPNKEAFIQFVLPVLDHFSSELSENKSDGNFHADN